MNECNMSDNLTNALRCRYPLKHQIHILIDDRERSSGVFSELAAMEDVGLDIGRLSVGDYQADGRFLSSTEGFLSR